MARYPFMTRNDGTEITFSSIRMENGIETVLVNFERWSEVHDDFDSMHITLPHGAMADIVGYSEKEVQEYTGLAKRYTPLFFKFAKQGGEEIEKRRLDTFEEIKFKPSKIQSKDDR